MMQSIYEQIRSSLLNKKATSLRTQKKSINVDRKFSKINAFYK